MGVGWPIPHLGWEWMVAEGVAGADFLSMTIMYLRIRYLWVAGEDILPMKDILLMTYIHTCLSHVKKTKKKKKKKHKRMHAYKRMYVYTKPYIYMQTQIISHTWTIYKYISIKMFHIHHTYIHTCVRACARACVSLYIHIDYVYEHTYMRACVRTYIGCLWTCGHAYVHYIHTYLHCMHTYIHTYQCVYEHTFSWRFAVNVYIM